jgi:Fur family transcriptional regulator, iron response regulator
MSTAPHSGSRDPAGLEAELRARGILPTRQRLEIAAIVLERPQHLCADELIHRLRQGGCRVSKATVYNTLGLFARRGLLREVIVDPSKVFYDSNANAHHHVFDTRTGTLTDVPADRLQVHGSAELPPGTVVEGVEVVVRVRTPGG